MSKKKDKIHKPHKMSDKYKSNLSPKKISGSNKSKTKRSKQKKLLNKPKNNKADLLRDIEKFTKGLTYISETDAEIFPFVGKFAEHVSVEELLSQLNLDLRSSYEETDFEDFFRHPSKIQDWFDESRIAQAKQYLALKNLLKDNLKDVKVYKVGDIHLDVYIVGLDIENKLIGIKTKAVET